MTAVAKVPLFLVINVVILLLSSSLSDAAFSCFIPVSSSSSLSLSSSFGYSSSSSKTTTTTTKKRVSYLSLLAVPKPPTSHSLLLSSLSKKEQQKKQKKLTVLFQSEISDDEEESVFIPPSEETDDNNDDSDDNNDETFDKVESFGKGSAKNKRGKRKSGIDSSSSSNNSKSPNKGTATLTPEETFYEGPPAITETIAPTVSILTVVGIIPAAAAWARQAWVRYKITSRRIRVTSGIGGNEMSEIVYPDIIEIRTAKRLFGDGDMVCFLRDGAKFEMRNIPNFDDTMDFILNQVDEDVADTYRNKGDVTNP